jgi:hypothetical protein
VDDSSDSALSQLSSTSKVSVSLRMTARSTTFCYSRMHFRSEWNSLGHPLRRSSGMRSRSSGWQLRSKCSLRFTSSRGTPMRSRASRFYLNRRAIRREDRDLHRDRVGDCELAHANLLLGALNTFGRSGEGEFLSCRPPGAATQPATRFRTVRYRHGGQPSSTPIRTTGQKKDPCNLEISG